MSVSDNPGVAGVSHEDVTNRERYMASAGTSLCFFYGNVNKRSQIQIKQPDHAP